MTCYWDSQDGKARATYLRRLIDQLVFAAAADGVEQRLRRSFNDASPARSEAELLRPLMSDSVLSYGARGEAALDLAICLAFANDDSADQIANTALRIVSEHPNCEELRALWAMLDVQIWQAAIRQRIGSLSTAAAREPLEVARGLLSASGRSYLSMELAFRDVAISIENGDEQDAVAVRLKRFEVDPGWRSGGWWHLGHALLLIWSEADRIDVLEALRNAKAAFEINDRIASDDPTFSCLILAVELCAILVLADNGQTELDLAEHLTSVLDQVLSLRVEHPIGPLTKTLHCVCQEILSVCAQRPNAATSRVAFRALDESHRAGIEVLLLQPSGPQEITHRQFANLVKRFRTAGSAITRFADVDQPLFAPEPLQEVRAELATSFPRFAELAAPVRSDFDDVSVQLGNRALLQYGLLPSFDDKDRWYCAATHGGLTHISSFELDENDRHKLANLKYEDNGSDWAKWWSQLAVKLIPEPFLVQLGRSDPENPIELVVVPDTLLHRVPWAALRLSDDLRLIDVAEINVIPSVRLLNCEHEQHGSFGKRLASWADTDEFAEVERVGWANTTDGWEQEEVDSLPHLLELLSVGNSTDFDLIHLSGHGHGHGAGGGLNQSVDVRGGGRLIAMEALCLRWPQTVTMSACHIFRAEDIPGSSSDDGSEMFGLALACIVGGAHQIVGGTAAIPSKPTAEIIRGLFERMADSGVENLPGALRHAQRLWLAQPHDEPVRVRHWALLAAMSRCPSVRTAL